MTLTFELWTSNLLHSYSCPGHSSTKFEVSTAFWLSRTDKQTDGSDARPHV